MTCTGSTFCCTDATEDQTNELAPECCCQFQRMDSGERYAKRRPEELISKYEKIKNTLNHYDNLPTALEPLSLLRKQQKNNKIMTVICMHVNYFRETMRSAGSSS